MMPSGTTPGADIDEVAGQDLFVMSEVVAFAGLASRDFFSHNYWSRDNFRLVLQNYEEPKPGTRYSTRRRDGATTVLVSETAHVVRTPEHVSVSSNVTLDEDLLQVLRSHKEHGDWDRLYEAILNFNLANTDSEAVSPSMEMVLMHAAFERLAGGSSGKCEPVITFIEESLGDFERLGPGDSERLSTEAWAARYSKRKTLASVWMHDFCALRRSVAHGINPDKFPSLWNLREHLLMGAFLFPVLLRRTAGLSDRSRKRTVIRAFERLLDVESFAVIGPEADPSELP